MIRLLIPVLTLFFLPPSVWAAGGSTGNKPTSNNKNYAQEQQKKNNSAFSWIKRNLIPSWKQRYDARRTALWNKPSGGHFTTPASAASGTPTQKPGFIRRRIIAVKKVSGRFFQRLRNAWRSRWNNRHVGSDRRTPLQNQSGFGTYIRRPHKHVPYSWRTLYDRRKRLRKPIAMKRTRRRKRKFGPQPPPHRRHRPPPPPPGWR